MNFVAKEVEVQKYWNEIQLDEKIKENTRQYPMFKFMEGPPFCNFSPHLGHLLTKTCKDAMNRYKSMNGFYTDPRCSFDVHGLPIETLAQKNLQVHSKQEILSLGIDKFNQECRGIVTTARDDWKRTTSRFGQRIDFERESKTMDLSYMNNVWKIFGHLYSKNLIYQGTKIMPYSTALSTVWSNFESSLNVKEVQDPALTLKFKLVGSNPFNLPNDKVHFLVFTTTPWTLPSNLMLAINPSLTYVIFTKKSKDEMDKFSLHFQKNVKNTENSLSTPNESADEYYICEKSSMNRYVNNEKTGVTSKGEQLYLITHKIVAEFPGSQLVNLQYQPPYNYFSNSDKFFKVLGADFVSNETGTGIVHIAPGFGADDYKLCLNNDIVTPEMNICPIDDAGCFTSEIKEYQGRHVKDCDKDIIKELKTRGLIFQSKYETHSYPYCWRSDTPLIYRAMPCWFIDVMSIKDKLIANNKKINWFPKHVGENRFGNWLNTLVDWCISRTRYWGTPIPIWMSQDKKEIKCISSLQELEELGYWTDGRKVQPGEIKDLHRDIIDNIVLPSKEFNEGNEGNEFLYRIEEVLDCWFESGSMPYASGIYGDFSVDNFTPGKYQSDFISESIDQVRGWFYTLNVLSTALFDEPAFKNCIVSGMILANDGTKMAKSKGNYTPPEIVMDKYGADALRLYLLESPAVSAESLQFKDENIEKIVKQTHVYLYNSVKFLHQMIDFYSQQNNNEMIVFDPSVQSTNILDIWLTNITNKYIEDIHSLADNYNLQHINNKIYNYIQDLSTWYLKLNRAYMKLYNVEDKQQVYNSLNTFYFNLVKFLNCSAPFMPMLSDILFLDIRKYSPIYKNVESIHLIQMPNTHNLENLNSNVPDNKLIETFKYLTDVITMGRYVRGTINASSRKPLKSMIVLAPNNIIEMLEPIKHYLYEELNVVDIVLTCDFDKYIVESLTLNDKIVGKKYRSKIKDLRKEIANLDPTTIQQFIKSKILTIQDISLIEEDIIVHRNISKDYSSLVFHSLENLSILVDKDMTHEMHLIYLGKQINRYIQDYRKQLSLVISDHVNVFYSIDFSGEESGSEQSKFVPNSDNILSEIISQQDIYITPYLNSEIFPVEKATEIPLNQKTFHFDENTRLTIFIQQLS